VRFAADAGEGSRPRAARVPVKGQDIDRFPPHHRTFRFLETPGSVRRRAIIRTVGFATNRGTRGFRGRPHAKRARGDCAGRAPRDLIGALEQERSRAGIAPVDIVHNVCRADFALQGAGGELASRRAVIPRARFVRHVQN